MALSREEIDEILTREELVYIATTKANGDPHIAPIWYVYYQGKVYFETDKTTVKFKNIQAKNKIALCFAGLNAYIIEGSVKWWTEQEAPVPFRQLFRDKYKEDMEEDFINENTLIFEVEIERVMSWHYAPSWK